MPVANRIRPLGCVIKDSLSNPDFGPIGAAAEVGISLRYVQKLFTERGTTCSEFISLRLDRAAHLLRRRASFRTGQALSEIAYACGFRDYARFARKFRHRFGYSPGAHAGNSDGIVRAGTGASASLTRDVQAPGS
jgi:AraC family transcriptional regulator, positive regulator of tynA and feaB